MVNYIIDSFMFPNEDVLQQYFYLNALILPSMSRIFTKQIKVFVLGLNSILFRHSREKTSNNAGSQEVLTSREMEE